MSNGKNDMATRYQYIPRRRRLSLIGFLFAKKVREIKCTLCGRPYIEHPDLEPDFRFRSNNVELMLYQDHSHRDLVFKARIGAWHLHGDQFHFGQLFTFDEMRSLVRVISDAVEFIKVEREVKSQGAVLKMSSR
jgi:hypothetical protein